MKTLKRCIGAGILLIVFGSIFVAMVVVYGSVVQAALVFGSVIAVPVAAAAIALAVYLII